MTNATARPSPTISLIVPAYNEEDYLPACLDAIMNNVAGEALEIIVIDNNSTDRTRQIIEGYPGVTYVFEPHKGITRARQCGFQAASGEIIAYVDADTQPPAGWIAQIREQFAARGLWRACRAHTASTIWGGHGTAFPGHGSSRQGRSTS
jgi:glycosyltransferase involved in cell wall biosynthesis